jgi:DNA-binding transcriptional LysR family regulator
MAAGVGIRDIVSFLTSVAVVREINPSKQPDHLPKFRDILPNNGTVMDRFQSMSVFLAVAEAGSFSAASRRLGIPLATVSRKVSELELHLKARLMIRSSRHLVLTDAGRSYVAACKAILENLEEAERAASGEYSAPKGHLSIAAPIVFGRTHVLPIIVEFLKAYPDINVKLSLADRLVNLAEEHVDIALRIGELPDSSLIAKRLGFTRRVVCGSPAYFAARGTPETPDELSRHSCLTFDALMQPGVWTFSKGNQTLNVPIHSRLSVNTAEAAIDAAIASAGVTRVLSYQVAEPVRAGLLQLVLRQFEPEPVPVSLIHSAQGVLPLKLRAFLDFAAPRLKARLAECAL